MRFDNCDCGNKKQTGSKTCVDCYNKTRFGKTSAHWKGGKIAKICVQCNKEYYTNKARVNSKFCSQECCGIWKHENLKGEKIYNYIKDRTKLKDDHRDRGGQLHRNWSNLVKERDKYTCKINNKDCFGKLEAHHILGWTKFPELKYSINNGITLCHFHHPRKRSEEKRLIPFFKQMVEVINKYFDRYIFIRPNTTFYTCRSWC